MTHAGTFRAGLHLGIVGAYAVAQALWKCAHVKPGLNSRHLLPEHGGSASPLGGTLQHVSYAAQQNAKK